MNTIHHELVDRSLPLDYTNSLDQKSLGRKSRFGGLITTSQFWEMGTNKYTSTQVHWHRKSKMVSSNVLRGIMLTNWP
jgi:hypothetical protein